MSRSQPLEKNYPELGAEEREKLLELERLILEWNQRINLISRKETAVLERHILPSLLPVKLDLLPKQGRVLDIGTGGGLPGLPLAIVQPHLRFTLLDATRKKLDAVGEMAKALELDNLEVLHERAEKAKLRAELITGRAVTALPKFVAMSKKMLSKGPEEGNEQRGILYWSGGNVEEEMEGIPAQVEVYPMADYLDEPSLSTKKLLHIIPR